MLLVPDISSAFVDPAPKIPTLILAPIRAGLIADGTDSATVAALGQVVPGVQFIGLMSIFSAIVFAIARILGAFREGGGSVLTLVMLPTAKAMLALMMMAMMVLVFAIIAHFVLAGIVGNAVLDGDQALVRTVSSRGTWLEGVPRLGVAVYLLSISLGLATVVTVIRLQSRRIRERLAEPVLSA